MTEKPQPDAPVIQWRTRDRYSADGNDWEDWSEWEDVEPGVHDIGFGPRAEFGGSAQIEFRVKPPEIVAAVRGAGKTPALAAHWSGTVARCGETDPHGAHTWQSGDDGFLGGGDDHLCPGYRGEGPETRQEWKESTYLAHYGYRGPWPLTPGQEVLAEDAVALYRATMERGSLADLLRLRDTSAEGGQR